MLYSSIANLIVVQAQCREYLYREKEVSVSQITLEGWSPRYILRLQQDVAYEQVGICNQSTMC